MSARQVRLLVAVCAACLSPLVAQRPVALENQLLLFVRDNGLHVRDLAAETERALHRQVAIEDVIAWRPDGLAVLTRRGGDVVQLVDVATGSVAPFPHAVQVASFAPDGGRVAFLEEGQLVIRDPATGKVTRTGQAGNPGAGPPSWHPEGGRVAFVGSSGRRAALQVFAGGGRADTLVTAQDIRHPAWTPDGKWIYYASGSDLNRIDVRTRSVETVDGGTGDAALPVIAANGSRLAYLRTGGADGEVRVVHRPQGRGPTSSTWSSFTGPPLPPSWSSDGRLLTFATVERTEAVARTLSAPGTEEDSTAVTATLLLLTSRTPPPEGTITGATGKGDTGDPVVVKLEFQCLEAHHEIEPTNGVVNSQLIVHPYASATAVDPETPSTSPVNVTTLKNGTNDLTPFTFTTSREKFSVTVLLVVKDKNLSSYPESRMEVVSLNALFTWDPGEDTSAGSWILQAIVPADCPEAK